MLVRLSDASKKDPSARGVSASLVSFVTYTARYGEALHELYHLGRIALCLAVSTATCERSFSALRQIKTLCATLCQTANYVTCRCWLLNVNGFIHSQLMLLWMHLPLPTRTDALHYCRILWLLMIFFTLCHHLNSSMLLQHFVLFFCAILIMVLLQTKKFVVK